jgi:hypothetical protein
MLLKVVRKNVPQTNGFLDDIETSFVGDVFTINFLKHGRDICENAGADKFLEEYILAHFDKKITVELEFEIEIRQRDLDKLDYIVDKLGRNVNNMIEIIDALG